jgi:hypothetical protein
VSCGAYGVFEDDLLVAGLDFVVLDGLAGLGVDPAGAAVVVVVADETHHPGQLDAALHRELAVGLHLPPGAGRAVGTHLAEAGHHHHALHVDHALDALELLEALLGGQRRELDVDVGPRAD